LGIWAGNFRRRVFCGRRRRTTTGEMGILTGAHHAQHGSPHQGESANASASTTGQPAAGEQDGSALRALIASISDRGGGGGCRLSLSRGHLRKGAAPPRCRCVLSALASYLLSLGRIEEEGARRRTDDV